MDLPKNARVVIVDDVYDEVKDLMAVLAKAGVSVAYFNGKKTSFPPRKLSGVRVLFLDLIMTANSTLPDPKTVASTAQGNYSSLIADDNGPVVVVLWTKHDLYSEAVEQSLKAHTKNPILIVCMEKGDCMTASKNFSVKKIKALLDERLSDVDVFGLCVAWENAVFAGTNQLSNRFARIAPMGEDWAKVMSYVYGKLYSTNSEGTEISDVQGQFASACCLYSEGLVQEIGTALCKTKLAIGPNFKFSNGGIPSQQIDEVKSRINAFLFYADNKTKDRVPGAVYAVKLALPRKEIMAAIVKDFYNEKYYEQLMDGSNVRVCKVVITPACDYAGGKQLHPGEKNDSSRNYDRVVYGLMINHALYDAIGRKIFSPSCPREKLYKELSGFEYHGKTYDLIIHLGTVSLEELGNRGLSYLFTLKSGCLADIQSKAANQLNRIGICSVK